MYPKIGVFDGENVKILCSNPQKVSLSDATFFELQRVNIYQRSDL